MQNDIHNYNRRYRSQLKVLNGSKDIDSEDKKLIEDIVKSCKRRISMPATVKYLYSLCKLSSYIKSSLKNATMDDIDDMFERLDDGRITKKDGMHYSQETIRDFKVSLKVFYKHIKREEIHKEINTTKPKQKDLDINTLWTEGEINKLISSIKDSQNKALASMTIDSGARIGEIATMTISNVILETDDLQPQEYVIQIIGKTGARTVMLTWSKEFVVKWLDQHPLRDKKNAPLWIGKENKRRQYDSLASVFKRAKKVCKIDKPANPHNFRKSMTTILRRKGYDIELIKRRHGWSRHSRVMDRYEAINDQALYSEERRINGIGESIKKIRPNSKTCPYCFAVNQMGSVNCHSCGEIVDIKKRERFLMSQQREIMRNEFSKMFKDMIKLSGNKLENLDQLTDMGSIITDKQQKFNDIVKSIR